MINRIFLLALFVLTICFSGNLALSQGKKDNLTNADLLAVDSTERPTLLLNPYEKKKEEDKKVKKVKRKRGTYLNLKVKKWMTKEFVNNKTVVEVFHLLREYQEPNKYVEYKYVFDYKTKKVVRTKKFDKELAMPLHGPYKRLVDGKLAEYGFYYAGVKHGRWERYGDDMLLLDKRKYNMGFPKESKILYYDGMMTRIKEVVPIHNKKKDGDYLRYYESGRIAEKGQYQEGVKVGKWFEYYDREKKNLKKEVQYPRTAYDKNQEIFVIREWNDKGEQVINNAAKSGDDDNDND